MGGGREGSEASWPRAAADLVRDLVTSSSECHKLRQSLHRTAEPKAVVMNVLPESFSTGLLCLIFWLCFGPLALSRLCCATVTCICQLEIETDLIPERKGSPASPECHKMPFSPFCFSEFS